MSGAPSPLIGNFVRRIFSHPIHWNLYGKVDMFFDCFIWLLQYQYSKRPTLLCTQLCPWNHLKRPLRHAHTYPQRCRVRAQATATLTTLATPRMYIDKCSVRVSKWGPCGTPAKLGSLLGFNKPRIHASCSSRVHGLGYSVLHHSTQYMLTQNFPSREAKNTCQDLWPGL